MAHLTEDVVMGRGGYGIGNVDGLGGGGLLTGLILASLLGRGNLLGGGADVVTKADLNQMTLGDIKAAIPFNEAQVQLALSNAVAGLTAQATANSHALGSQIGALALSTNENFSDVAKQICDVDTNVDRTATAIQMAINADGQATRALITSNQIAELNQRLTVAQTEALELRQRNERDRDRHGIEITMTNNQNQLQMQQQQQAILLNQLVGAFGQVARAANSNVVVGSTGVGTQQTANPTNVAA